LRQLLSKLGITLHLGKAVVRLDGDGRVQRILLGNGSTVPCDLAIAAVGMTIGRELLRGTPIAAETAILIDDSCRTSVAGIYAAGDCSAIFDPLFGKHRVVDHVDHARLTGNIAGANMAGGEERYTQLSHYWSTVVGQRIDVWGESKLVYRHIVRGHPGSGEFAEFGIAADNRVAQVIAVGRAHEHAALRFCVEKRLNVSQWESSLTNPAHDLSSVM
jgi:NADPH-dependent 2,4-dienoyl-CoA reductase/sulfur reductase-like enzyme